MPLESPFAGAASGKTRRFGQGAWRKCLAGSCRGTSGTTTFSLTIPAEDPLGRPGCNLSFLAHSSAVLDEFGRDDCGPGDENAPPDAFFFNPMGHPSVACWIAPSLSLASLEANTKKIPPGKHRPSRPGTFQVDVANPGSMEKRAPAS